MQKARRQSEDLRLIVSTRFQDLFHSLLRGLFTFPSQYWFTIGHRWVFSLRWWSTQIHSGFHVSRATREIFRRQIVFVYKTITHYGWTFQIIPLTKCFLTPWSTYRHFWILPQPFICNDCNLTHIKFRLFPVRSPLLRKSFLLSLPGGTEMFQFSPFASLSLCVQQRDNET